ncbi:MAG: hypothetical protein Q9M45_12665 [Robiginitomaculum sp.]|nr:hypothetical protein [Robiginitomaculum sp.]
MEFLAKASELAPEDQTYQAYHARTLANLGQFEAAKARADHMTKVGINDAVLADMVGLVYSRSGYHDLALPLFELATKKEASPCRVSL